jgi:hypothetical protein
MSTLRQGLKDEYQRAFNGQKRNAKKRGIEWRLQYWEWLQIWEESGHWHERGKNAGEYVMARHGDKGPYEYGNVKIITADANNYEASQTRWRDKRGRAHVRAG